MSQKGCFTAEIIPIEPRTDNAV